MKQYSHGYRRFSVVQNDRQESSSESSRMSLQYIHLNSIKSKCNEAIPILDQVALNTEKVIVIWDELDMRCVSDSYSKLGAIILNISLWKVSSKCTSVT